MKIYIILCILFLSSSFVFSQSNEIDPNGFNVFYYENGMISSEGTMKDGKPEGYWKTFYPTGKMKSEGNRKDFQLDSLWKFYNEQGILIDEINYREGLKKGISKKYSVQGFLLYRENFVDNIAHGKKEFYYESGEVFKLVNLEKGKENGSGFEYSKDGRIITLLKYKMGFLRSREEINRKDKQHKKQGHWKEFYSNGKLRWECQYFNDLRNGVYKEYDKVGKLIRIEKYIKGEIQSDAREVLVVDIKKDYFPDGSVKSECGFIGGKKQGVYREFDENGNIISSGLYSNGIKMSDGLITPKGTYEGYWKLYFITGELKAEGEYLSGKKIGEWKYYYLDGQLAQEGSFNKEGDYHGEWKWYYENGELHRLENYYKGKEEGEFIEYDVQGEVLLSGEFFDGFKEGPWFYLVGDHKEEGEYGEGLKHGDWVYTYDNGKLNFKGKFIDGNPVGKHLFYFRNGKTKTEGNYQMGVKTGEWRRFNPQGELVMTLSYKGGKVVKIDGTKIKPGFEEVVLELEY